MMPAFGSDTGIPHFWVNLRTGEVKGDTVNVAEGGSCLLEMGILSYYTQDPVYYQAAKKASRYIFDARSKLDLIGQNINIETGQWLDNVSHIGCCVDSYYEYLYKSWLLFGDPDLKTMWDVSITAIQKNIAEESDTSLWYGMVDMQTGDKLDSRVTLYDAYFPALLALSGDVHRAGKSQVSWDYLWNLYGLEPMAYNYADNEILDPRYYLNPEIMESAYYLFHYTRDSLFYNMAVQYYQDLKQYCRTEIAYAHIDDVISKEKANAMSTFFIAETMKYFYLIFAENADVNLDTHVFSTEAHPFKKANFVTDKIKNGLGI